MGAAGEPEQIEVGASRRSGELRYWKAKYAIDKGEILINAQLNSVPRQTTGATSLLGWSITISIALTAVITTSLQPPIASKAGSQSTSYFSGHLLWPAVATELFLLVSAICCVRVLWPGGIWFSPGLSPTDLLNAPHDTELTTLEALARGYADRIDDNYQRLQYLVWFLRVAWICFVVSPVAGLVAYFISVS